MDDQSDQHRKQGLCGNIRLFNLDVPPVEKDMSLVLEVTEKGDLPVDIYRDFLILFTVVLDILM